MVGAMVAIDTRLAMTRSPQTTLHHDRSAKRRSEPSSPQGSRCVCTSHLRAQHTHRCHRNSHNQSSHHVCKSRSIAPHRRWCALPSKRRSTWYRSIPIPGERSAQTSGMSSVRTSLTWDCRQRRRKAALAPSASRPPRTSTRASEQTIVRGPISDQTRLLHPLAYWASGRKTPIERRPPVCRKVARTHGGSVSPPHRLLPLQAAANRASPQCRLLTLRKAPQSLSQAIPSRERLTTTA